MVHKQVVNENVFMGGFAIFEFITLLRVKCTQQSHAAAVRTFGEAVLQLFFPILRGSSNEFKTQ